MPRVKGAINTDKKRITAKPKVKSSRPAKPDSSNIKIKASALSAQVFDTAGRKQGTVGLPKEIFGQKPNEKLLAQTIRVYMTNQLTHPAHVKTRGEVSGGGVKPWRQKGTGRARAGSIRSPLWVGGGRVHGPRYRDVKLTLPKKMKRKALAQALSLKLQEGNILIIKNVEKIEPKTKFMANLLEKIGADGDTLLVILPKSAGDRQNVSLATRNIQRLSVLNLSNLNAYEIIKNNKILMSREALRSYE